MNPDKDSRCADAQSSWQNTGLISKDQAAHPAAHTVQVQAGDLPTPEESLQRLEIRTSQGSTTSFSQSASGPLITPRRSEALCSPAPHKHAMY